MTQVSPIPETTEPASAPAARQEAPIARPGETCWRREHSDRAAFLIDGKAYFSALRSALIKAERSIFIIGWELHSQVLLEPDKPAEGDLEDGWPNRLHELLTALTRRKKKLQVYVLLWDFAMLYMLEREILPLFRLPWQSSRRVHFHMDSQHPTGASHHQKLVVIDDQVAFAGGLDVTGGRWDTPAHAANDGRRRTPSGEAYGPFHDIQMVVDGTAARHLGDLARERWERAKGRRPDVQQADSDPWPHGLEPDVTDVKVAIARTEACYRGNPEVREVEALYVASIAAAKKTIYVENQYFTSVRIGDAIEESLRQDQGPEIVFIGSRLCGGWLEQSTMGLGRSRLLKRLRDADRHGRFAAYYPSMEEQRPDCCITVHAKIMVVDDRLLRIGSSNLANRSMGLDTECDLAIESEGRDDIAAAITGFRTRLLAEHLDCEPGAVQQALRSEGSLIAAIDALRGDGRSLQVIDDELPETLNSLAPDVRVMDPERPIDAETLAARMLDLQMGGEERPEDESALEQPSHGPTRRGKRLWLFGGLVLLAVLLVLAWSFTPLREIAAPEKIMDWIQSWRDSPLAPFIVLALFVVAGLIVFPVTVLLSAVGVLFDPLWGFVYGLGGSTLSAAVLFCLGHVCGRNAVSRLAGRHVNKLSKQIGRHGIKAVFLFRVLPIAPFSVVNIVAGASQIRFRDFIIGTVAGMAPGVFALVMFGDSLIGMLKDPSPSTVALLVGSLALVLGLGYAAQRWANRKGTSGPQPQSSTDS